MIRRTETIEIELTTREVGEIIVNMDNEEQANVLRQLADYHMFYFADFVMQLEYIKEVIEGFLPVDKERIKGMFDSFVEYIETIDWKGGTECLKQKGT